MKKQFLIVISGLFIISCNNGGDKTSSTTETMVTTNDSPNNSMVNPIDSGNAGPGMNASGNKPSVTNEFVNKAAAGGMMEVDMGKLAQTNGGSDEVKNYGKMLEADHTAANNKLKSIAMEENIILPDAMLPEQKQHMDHLQMLKGKDFDKAFKPMMIEDHTKDIAEFKKAAAGNENEKIKNFAKETLPTLEAHLSKAKSIKLK